MRLRAFRVRLFRNIIDSGRIDVDDLTCLVGKNESGKSALLQALHTLNPARPEVRFDLLDEYPRWLKKEHEISGEINSAVPITAEYELSDDELAELETKFGAGILASTTVAAYRRYASPRIEMDVPINYEAFIEPFVAGLPQRLQQALWSPSTSDELIKQITAIATPEDATEPGAAQLASDALSALGRLAKVLGDGNLRGAVEKHLRQRLPKTFYFSSYAQLAGRYNLDEVFYAVRHGSNSEELQSAADFLNLAQVVPAALEDWNFEASNAELESVSSLLTRRVKEHWRQSEHLRLRVTLEAQRVPGSMGDEVRRFLQFRVEDMRHEFSNPLDRRSTGFRWFVSFIASFVALEKERNLILLLDEPGLSLHARAQTDLMNTIENKLAAKHQVIYSTHSPFMVRTGELGRTRVVEDHGSEIGAVATTDASTLGDADTLYPLQAAIGLDVAQGLLGESRHVVVDGPAEFIYLTTVSEYLRSRGRAGLPQQCRVLPIGGVANVWPLIAVLGAQLGAAVLLDGSTSSRIEDALVRGGLTTDRVLRLDVVSPVEDADIEDLFTPNEYLALYNGAFKRSLKMGELAGTDRIVERIARVDGDVDADAVAAHFLRHLPKSVGALSAATLDRFEELFVRISGTLPPR